MVSSGSMGAQTKMAPEGAIFASQQLKRLGLLALFAAANGQNARQSGAEQRDRQRLGHTFRGKGYTTNYRVLGSLVENVESFIIADRVICVRQVVGDFGSR
jgi:hypothetical protein